MPKRKGIYSSEDLREDLQCPVCFSIPRSGPIYQCESGHLHCKKCHPGLRQCPICRGQIGNTRSLMTEKLIAKLTTKCSFTEQGCCEDEKLPEEMLLHERACNFRLVKCLFIACDEKVPVADLLDHSKLKHVDKNMPILEIDSACLSLSVPKAGFYLNPRFIRSRKHYFASHLEVDDRGFFFLFIHILGSQADIDREEYKCKIKMMNSDKDQDYRTCYDGYINIIGDSDPVPSVALDPRQIAKYLVSDGPLLIKVRFEIMISSSTHMDRDELIYQERNNDLSNFIKACHDGNEAKVDRMLKNNGEVQKKLNNFTACGMNGLMIACRRGCAEVVNLILKKARELELNVNVNAKDKKKGQTALTMAVLEGNLEIVKILTQEPSFKVDFNTADAAYSKTPLIYACQFGFTDIAKYLLESFESETLNGPFDLNAADDNGNTALHHASLCQNEDIVDLILEAAERMEIDVELKNNDGKTGSDLWPDKFEEHRKIQRKVVDKLLF